MVQHQLGQQAQAFGGIVIVLFPPGVVGEIMVCESVQW